LEPPVSKWLEARYYFRITSILFFIIIFST